MAEVTVADIIEPTVFNDYQFEFTAELSEFFQSGIITEQAPITELAAGKGYIMHKPAWTDLFTAGATQANLSNSDSASNATPANIGSFDEIMVKNYRNQHWAAMDLSAVVAGDDPMMVIASGLSRYWSREWQLTLMSIVEGVLADNVANDASDMSHSDYTDSAAGLGDLATQSVGDPMPDAFQISAAGIIDAQTTAGDAGPNQFAGIAMRSGPYGQLRKKNLIDFIPNARGETLLAFYLDMRVIVDDGMPSNAGTNQEELITVLFAPGSFAFGRGNPRVPLEVDRLPLSGNGGGQEILSSRQDYVIHPNNFSFVLETSLGGLAASNSPSNTEFQTATTWNRVSTDRKHVRWAVLRHNDTVVA